MSAPPDPTPDPAPDPAPTEGPTPGAGAAPPSGRPWRRRLARAAAVLVGLPVLLIVVAQVRLRHVPWTVPEDQRPPALATGAFTPGPGAALRLRYLGISGYELTDGTTTLLLDPQPTRPSGLALLLPIDADPALAERWCPRADFVLVNHTHHDHGMDAGVIARRTGATVVGTQSTLNLARSRGVAPDKLRLARPGEPMRLGTFDVDVCSSRHTDIIVSNPMSGVVAPDAGRLFFWQYSQDGCVGFRLRSNGASVWFHPTSTWAPGELMGLPAATLILGINGEPMYGEKVRGILAECRPRRVLPTHYDNFLQPIEKGLALMPGLDYEAARQAVREAAPDAAWWALDYDWSVDLPPD